MNRGNTAGICCKCRGLNPAPKLKATENAQKLRERLCVITETITELWPGLTGSAIRGGRLVEGVVVDLLKAADRVIIEAEMCPECKRIRVELITGGVVCGCE